MKKIKDLMNLDKGDLIAGGLGILAAPIIPAAPLLAVGANKVVSAVLNGIQNENEDEDEEEDEEEDDTTAIDKIFDEEDPEVKLKLLEEYKEDVPECLYHLAKGNCFFKMAEEKEEELDEYDIDDEDENDEEVQSIKRDIKRYKSKAKQEYYKSLEIDDPITNRYAHYGLYFIEISKEEYDVFNARRHAIAALGGADEEIDVNEHYSRITDYVIEQEGLFLSQPYGQRQFLYMARNDNDIAGCYDDNIYNVFTIQKYPQEFSFPAGHPQPNSLYYAHPAIHGYYIPIDTADEILFKDKVNAFCQLAQCLGATEITFKSTKGKRLDESTMTSLDIEAGGEYKGFGGSAGYNNNRKKTEKSTHDEASLMRQTYNPTILPYIPNDNYWYKVDNDWHRLAKQRMEGNMLHYSTKISSHDTMAVTGAQMDGVKAAFNAFVAKGNASVNIQKETSFEREEETEWEISVEFKPLCEFELSSNEISASEQEYIEELKEMLAEGELTQRERRLLDKIRISLGISEERAKLLEESLQPKLTDEEQEYLDEYKAVIAEGEPTDRDFRLLSKLRIALCISEERAAEIERLAASMA